MVHIKRIELTNFKSFGGTTPVPLLPGFTVISGPNGSGKSNILDALLFCLGLSTSKGMRAERLPDLVNNQQNRRGTIEASVTVTFDLQGLGEGWLAPEEEILETDDLEAEYPAINIDGTATDLATDEGELNLDLSNSLEGMPETLDGLSPTSPSQARDRVATKPTVLEWSVTRKLRVTKQGTYTSTYYINGNPCTLTELHEQLNRLRIYPEGYNVVLQGDVTGIISMNARERREIIDELAGVAQFDRKISLAKDKLDEVKQHEERSRIVEKELIGQRDRLAADRSKAEKYQKLRAELQEKSLWEVVLKFRHLQQQEWQLREQIEAGDRTLADLTTQQQSLEAQIQQVGRELDELNAQVKALGESELIALQSTLATQEAERRQLQQRQQELENTAKQLTGQIQATQRELEQNRETLAHVTTQQANEARSIESLQDARNRAQNLLQQSREAANAIAATAEAWVQQQTELHHRIESLQQTLEPQRSEQAQLKERTQQLQRQIQEQTQSLQTVEQELATKQSQLIQAQDAKNHLSLQVESVSQILTAAEQELHLQQETQTRLLEEQRERQRKLDKLEVQIQAMQEATGTSTTKAILQSGLTGICGLVAQLGRVEPRYQLALEVAAGARMGNMVVEDDGVAAAAIELLKQTRAGRMTFLPLNKVKGLRFSPPDNLRRAAGYVDCAVNLIECDSRYRDIFAYVFGNTVVFNNLSDARRHLGVYRIVTLDGEILEASGAMTGGSISTRSQLHFGTSDAGESAIELRVMASLQERLQEIERILVRCQSAIAQASNQVKARSQELIEVKQNQRESQLKWEQLQAEIKSLTTQRDQVRSLLAKNTQELATSQTRLQSLERDLPEQQSLLQQYRRDLTQLEETNSHSEWQQMQTTLRTLETELQQRETALREAQQRVATLENQQQRLTEKNQEASKSLELYHSQLTSVNEQQTSVNHQRAAIVEEISKTKIALTAIEERLGEEKLARDRAEALLRERHLAKQQIEWQQQKLGETQQERREQLATVRAQLETQRGELPDPIPELPSEAGKIDLSELQQDVKSLQKRIQALEPVNMLALEEYNRTQERLQELSQKLATLEGERTELLLRIENFTTLRRRAFKEAFDAVNENFQTIFAELSEGDGYLQLDDPEDPFSSGLNLVAHPKGKPVQRLASMSGGEKSLTALSFIFALQRYRPSTFYAFDEVDMFLDGANVERLARMIKRQSQQAQFIVVSLRRPMIESAERTIGVTQARGAYTQVLGLKLPPRSPSL